MAKNQKCGLSEDAELHGWGGGGTWERRGGAHMAIKGSRALQTCPGALGSSSLVPEVSSRLLYSESLLSSYLQTSPLPH